MYKPMALPPEPSHTLHRPAENAIAARPKVCSAAVRRLVILSAKCASSTTASTRRIWPPPHHPAPDKPRTPNPTSKSHPNTRDAPHVLRFTFYVLRLTPPPKRNKPQTPPPPHTSTA